jgi:hypothetical protein
MLPGRKRCGNIITFDIKIVLSFEPMPHNFKYILDLEEKKGWSEKSPHLLLMAAVADKNGIAEFFSSGKTGGVLYSNSL